MKKPAYTLPGLAVSIDKLLYHTPAPEEGPSDVHAFIYFLTIHNQSVHHIKILGRRWILSQRNGHTFILEGQGVVGKLPFLEPGQQFSYNSYHLVRYSTLAVGSFHALDENGQHVLIRIPPFEMMIPGH